METLAKLALMEIVVLFVVVMVLAAVAIGDRIVTVVVAIVLTVMKLPIARR